jgi:uncharacterized protein with HEPN domain
MTERRLEDSLVDILEAITEIEMFMEGVDLDRFLRNREKVLAVVKLLEIIGEATKKIPSSIREKYPEIPWRSVAGMRDVLVHEYWQVDELVVWETVTEALPLLKKTIIKIINS